MHGTDVTVTWTMRGWSPTRRISSAARSASRGVTKIAPRIAVVDRQPLVDRPVVGRAREVGGQVDVRQPAEAEEAGGVEDRVGDVVRSRWCDTTYSGSEPGVPPPGGTASSLYAPIAL